MAARLSLVQDWKSVVWRAWSLRLIALSLVLDGAEFAVDFLSDDPPLPRGTFLALAVAVKIAAGAARLVAQPCFSGGRNEQA